MARFITDDGVGIRYQLAGPDDGFPTLLMHGFASDYELNWVGSRWVQALTNAGRLVVGVDGRGHGQSDKPHGSEHYGASRMARDLANLLDHLGIARSDFVGYSMGSRIGLQLMLEEPGRVRRAVLGGYGRTGRFSEAAAIASRLRGEQSGSTPVAEFFYRFAVSRPGHDLEALASCITGHTEPLRPEQLATISTPVLLLVGGDDPLAEGAAEMARMLPRAELLTLPGRNHMNAVPAAAGKVAAVDFLTRGEIPHEAGA